MGLVNLPAGRGDLASRLNRAGGFSLIELLVTIAVVAVLATIAAPGFTALINANKLNSVANELVAALQITRSEAVRLNTRAVMCRSVDGSTCSAGGSWDRWLVLADVDHDGSVDDIVRVGSIQSPVTVSTSRNITSSAVTFRPSGFAYGNGSALLEAVIQVCIPTKKPVENIRSIAIGSGSRVSVSSKSGGGICPAPQDQP